MEAFRSKNIETLSIFKRLKVTEPENIVAKTHRYNKTVAGLFNNIDNISKNIKVVPEKKDEDHIRSYLLKRFKEYKQANNFGRRLSIETSASLSKNFGLKKYRTEVAIDPTRSKDYGGIGKLDDGLRGKTALVFKDMSVAQKGNARLIVPYIHKDNNSSSNNKYVIDGQSTPRKGVLRNVITTSSIAEESINHSKKTIDYDIDTDKSTFFKNVLLKTALGVNKKKSVLYKILKGDNKNKKQSLPLLEAQSETIEYPRTERSKRITTKLTIKPLTERNLMNNK
jgi:hypothetical protein